ncbi:hypothetical protein FACS1894139_08360 [Planctomycetales bacterium]|nr:hypothetical protein FACS1894108_01500 [Planctomycetales bacterium]GHT05110.1 hypothetical protein FACS1894139_08360 [Planctomycetales bacterium]GHV20653.1 hypothetical protein AGMMS49959_08460 [Planctomycetales bacterium]
MKTMEAVKLFLLGVVVTLLLLVVLKDGLPTAYADQAAGSGGIVALTADVGSGGNKKVGLFLLDAAKQQIGYYIADDRNQFNLVAGRSYRYDLTPDLDLPFDGKGYSFRQVREAARAANKKDR